jgi:hypothetical protein
MARAIGGCRVYVYTELHRRGIWTVNHFDYRVVILKKGIVSNNYVDIPEDRWYNIGRAF